jgi:hypothetical protein
MKFDWTEEYTRVFVPLRKGLASLAFASAFFCGTVTMVSLVSRIEFKSNAVRTTGSIVGLRESRVHTSSGVSQVASRVVLFRDAAGREYTFHSNVGSYRPDYEVGDDVPVLYRSDRPLDAKIDNFLSVWALPFVTGIATMIDIGVGMALWLGPRLISRYRHEARSAAPAQ